MSQQSQKWIIYPQPYLLMPCELEAKCPAAPCLDVQTVQMKANNWIFSPLRCAACSCTKIVKCVIGPHLYYI